MISNQLIEYYNSVVLVIIQIISLLTNFSKKKLIKIDFYCDYKMFNFCITLVFCQLIDTFYFSFLFML